jgi:hypothetical protein
MSCFNPGVQMKFLLISLTLVGVLGFPNFGAAQEDYPHFEYTAYGYFTAKQYDTFKTVQNLSPYTKREVDPTEFSLEGKLFLNPTSAIEFEVEFEHGGTGSATEFDNFEEFGEFETEIEKGGEVILHEIYYEKYFANKIKMKVGKAPLFISLSSILTSPKKHLNVQVSDLEVRMIPPGWTEIGVQAEKRFGMVKIGAGIINGLDSEFFNSPTWLGNGYQRRFESTNADDVAGLLNIEYGSVREAYGFALAGYYGNTQNNRYKKDKLTTSANVQLMSALLNYRFGRLGITGQSLWGSLENSDLVSAANNNMANSVKPKQANLGAKAVLQTLQLSYFLTDDLAVYLQKEHVNTFADVIGNNYVDPRYDSESNSIGLAQWWDQYCFVKIQYSKEKTQLVGLPETSNLRIAFGFDLDNI